MREHAQIKAAFNDEHLGSPFDGAWFFCFFFLREHETRSLRIINTYITIKYFVMNAYFIHGVYVYYFIQFSFELLDRSI